MILEHVGLAVTDLDRSIDFYIAVFGFSMLRRTTINAYLHLGDELLELIRADAPREPPRPRTPDEWRAEMAKHLGLNHVGFRVDDLAAAIEELERRGGTLVVPPFEFTPVIEHVAEPGSEKLYRAARPREGSSWRVAVFADPDGTMLELLER
jgi:catechol 2,3-dioxygenase-like lactoylglutathione lyase family enzyme